jgi:integrase
MNRPKTITQSQAHAIARFLNVIERQIFLLCIETGLRISDVLRLRKATIRNNPMQVYETKSKRIRSVTVSDELHAELLRWHNHGSDDTFVFYSLRDMCKPYNRMTFHRKLKEAAKYAKVEASAHSTRKLYAQTVYKRTGDIRAVQEAMHHKYLSTTATYLDIDIDALILEVLNPK